MPRKVRRREVPMVTVVINGHPMLLPDVTSEAFRRQARLDSIAIANSPTEAEDQAFIDSMSVLNDPDSETWWTGDAVIPDKPGDKNS